MNHYSAMHRRFRPQAIRAQDLHLRVLRSGKMQLRHSQLFADPAGDFCRTFLDRLFAIEEILHVCIEPRIGLVTIEQRPNQSSTASLLSRIAQVFSETRTTHPANLHLYLNRKRGAAVHVFRHGSNVSTWKVIHDLPGRTRFGHVALSGQKKVADFLDQELSATFGVLESKANPRTGTVLINFNDQVVTTSHLLHVLEGMLHDFENPRSRSYAHSGASLTLTYTSLGLAAAADFFFPVLLPASGLLLALTNIVTLKAAWKELRSKRLGVSVLYVTIVVATIVSGAFFTAALMGWFVQFWDRRSHRELSDAQRKLLQGFRRRSRFAWLCRDDVELEVPVERLQPGDTVAIQSGEMIPADGVIVSGRAEVDERLVRGVEGLTTKAIGDQVFANSLVFDGGLRVRVTRSSDNSRAANIVSALEHASTPEPAHLKQRGQAFASRTVPPTLAAAGVGLMVGDIGTALAILRPDYWSGPGMSQPLGNLHDVVDCARRGIVVRDASVLHRFAKSDLMLIDLQSALRGYQAALGGKARNPDIVLHEMRREIRRLRREGAFRVGLISEAKAAHVEECAKFLGVDFFESGLLDDDKAASVYRHSELGHSVAFVGDCLQYSAAAAQAHVAISVSDIEESAEHADVFLLDAQLSKLGAFWDITRDYQRRSRTHESWIVVPNVFVVAGAFALGFTSLHAVLITNLGVYSVYRSGKKWLRKLQHQQAHDDQHRTACAIVNPENSLSVVTENADLMQAWRSRRWLEPAPASNGQSGPHPTRSAS